MHAISWYYKPIAKLKNQLYQCVIFFKNQKFSKFDNFWLKSYKDGNRVVIIYLSEERKMKVKRRGYLFGVFFALCLCMSITQAVNPPEDGPLTQRMLDTGYEYGACTGKMTWTDRNDDVL